MTPGGEAEGAYGLLADFTILPNPPSLALQVQKAYTQKFGDYKEMGPYWSLPIWYYRAVVEKAGSFDPAAIDAAMAGLTIDTPIGNATMIKRPDYNNPKYVQTLSALALAQVKDGKFAYVVGMQPDEMISTLEAAFGFKGQWK